MIVYHSNNQPINQSIKSKALKFSSSPLFYIIPSSHKMHMLKLLFLLRNII